MNFIGDAPFNGISFVSTERRRSIMGADMEIIVTFSLISMRSILDVFLFMILLNSCANKTAIAPALKKATFTSFGMSYYSGFEGHFNVVIDSNKIFFSNQGLGIQYGILPDSIFMLIDRAVTTASKKGNSLLKIKDCEDCSMIGITCIINSDTIKISQQGAEIESAFRKLCWPIYNLTRQNNNTVPTNEPFFNTRKLFGNLPPPFPG